MKFMVRAFLSGITAATLLGCAEPALRKDEGAGSVADALATSADITEADLARHVAVLASDTFEGRAPGTPGGAKARAYIAAEFNRIGLAPIGDRYEMPVPLVEATLDPAASYFNIESSGQTLALNYRSDIVFWTKRVTPEILVEPSEMLFVGYGIVAPEYGWNDYADTDVQGKTVVMLINDPGFATGDPAMFNGKAMTYYGRWTYKFEEAARQGAAAALIIHEDAAAAYGWGVVEGSWSGPQLDLQRRDNGAGRVAIEGWISNPAANAIAGAAGLDLLTLQNQAKRLGFKPIPLSGLSASGAIKQTTRVSEDANVVGVLKGSSKPNEFVLYTAHWDHLGTDPDAPDGDTVFNGAVDNATGVAAVLEIAEKFARGPLRPERSIIIAAVTAEESGLLGSAYMAANPPVPLETMVAGINIDALMPVSPARDITVIGFGGSELDDILSTAAAARGITVSPDPSPELGGFYRSDHISFAKLGVPMLYATSGVDLVEGGVDAGVASRADYTRNRYHKPSDEFTPEWRFDGIVQTVDVLFDVGFTLANSGLWPNWRENNEFRSLKDALNERREETERGARQ